ncbi:translation initiation factor eIF-2B subunit epsilon-like isoform X3 [Salvia divinorum]|uniref:Translation initiation factor eIF2B subunit epsilon n=1 Tax=Salvia divinorum TaxID=28513 RepID=A0ABD1HM19_SALDI
MAAKKASRGLGGAGEEREPPLQAILLADSFAALFRPVTLERPKVLLPLVNAPMIEYTLSWLEFAGVGEVFVVCCAHSDQVIEYLESSNWLNQTSFRVSAIKSCNAAGAGDALRSIHERNVIRGDFVLVTGDTVSNMPLTRVVKEHRERRKRDSNAVMTMVIKQSKPSHLGTEGELFMAIDPATKELLCYDYEDKDRAVLLDRCSIPLHNDKRDCYIDICSPEVLSLFAHNFDYQHLRLHFVQGLLVDDLMGYKVFTHEIRSSYAARVENYMSYGTISRDIVIQNSLTYRGVSIDVGRSRSAKIDPFTVVGSGTIIGENSEVSNSVVGEGCVIGSNVSIDGCYIWNKVSIEDGCRLKDAIVCDGVIMKSGVVLEAGAVLSYNVVIGQNFVVPAYTKVSLLQQPVIVGQDSDSDEELECSGNNNSRSGNTGIASVSEVGGAGFIWSVGEEERRHPVAPILKSATNNGLDTSNAESAGESGLDSSDDEEFEEEVEATFLRAMHENVEEDCVMFELTSLRLTHDMMDYTYCANALFYAMMKYAVDSSAGDDQLLEVTEGVIEKWKKVLKYYLRSSDAEIEVILRFEEMCLESTKEYASLFPNILHLLYDRDVLREDSILRWGSEKEHGDESDKVFVKKAEGFLQWLKERRKEKIEG